ncbi:MAG: hypothetical protein ABIN89_22885 [Chitinophagaceae bacterium]
MDVYYIISNDIENMGEFKKYPPIAVPLINKFGDEVIISDTEANSIEGRDKKNERPGKISLHSIGIKLVQRCGIIKKWQSSG